MIPRVDLKVRMVSCKETSIGSEAVYGEMARGSHVDLAEQLTDALGCDGEVAVGLVEHSVKACYHVLYTGA